jgi:hypothetical protein
VPAADAGAAARPDHGRRLDAGAPARHELPPDTGRRADSLLLHMLGRWEIVFELRAGERALRLTDGLVLR